MATYNTDESEDLLADYFRISDDEMARLNALITIETEYQSEISTNLELDDSDQHHEMVTK